MFETKLALSFRISQPMTDNSKVLQIKLISLRDMPYVLDEKASELKQQNFHIPNAEFKEINIKGIRSLENKNSYTL